MTAIAKALRILLCYTPATPFWGTVSGQQAIETLPSLRQFIPYLLYRISLSPPITWGVLFAKQKPVGGYGGLETYVPVISCYIPLNKP